MGFSGVSRISALRTMDVIRGEQGEIHPCTSFPAACGGTKECHAEARRWRVRPRRRWIFKTGLLRAAQYSGPLPTKRTSPRYLCVLRLCGESFARLRKEIHRKDAKAPRDRVEGASRRKRGSIIAPSARRFHEPSDAGGTCIRLGISATPRLRVQIFSQPDRCRQDVHSSPRLRVQNHLAAGWAPTRMAIRRPGRSRFRYSPCQRARRPMGAAAWNIT
jgi:hypothetical protein